MRARVRMYCQGLGDCFLLTFSDRSAFAAKGCVHVLIDCGVMLGTEGSSDRLGKVLADVRTATRGSPLTVVATHEHWDHVAGFGHETFATIQVNETWFGWTEDLDDPQAKRLREERVTRLEQLEGAVALWRERARGEPGVGQAIEATKEVLAFSADHEVQASGKAKRARASVRKKAPETTRGALDALCARESARYLEPGQSFLLEGTAAVRVYVLGPPRDEGYLRNSRPSKRRGDTYGEEPPPNTLASSFLGAVADRRSSPSVGRGHATPFKPSLCIPEQGAKHDAFFSRHYGFGADDPFRGIANGWRRIDADWLATTADLALALDKDTNNTSLVLAFELGEGGPVILMAGDAQVGNWRSWSEVRFRVPRGRRTVTITAHELLTRTVVYKGMLTTPQLRDFYPDLSDHRVESAIALVHSRFSWNFCCRAVAK